MVRITRGRGWSFWCCLVMMLWLLVVVIFVCDAEEEERVLATTAETAIGSFPSTTVGSGSATTGLMDKYVDESIDGSSSNNVLHRSSSSYSSARTSAATSTRTTRVTGNHGTATSHLLNQDQEHVLLLRALQGDNDVAVDFDDECSNEGFGTPVLVVYKANNTLLVNSTTTAASTTATNNTNDGSGATGGGAVGTGSSGGNGVGTTSTGGTVGASVVTPKIPPGELELFQDLYVSTYNSFHDEENLVDDGEEEEETCDPQYRKIQFATATPNITISGLGSSATTHNNKNKKNHTTVGGRDDEIGQVIITGPLGPVRRQRQRQRKLFVRRILQDDTNLQDDVTPPAVESQPSGGGGTAATAATATTSTSGSTIPNNYNFLIPPGSSVMLLDVLGTCRACGGNSLAFNLFDDTSNSNNSNNGGVGTRRTTSKRKLQVGEVGDEGECTCPEDAILRGVPGDAFQRSFELALNSTENITFVKSITNVIQVEERECLSDAEEQNKLYIAFEIQVGFHISDSLLDKIDVVRNMEQAVAMAYNGLAQSLCDPLFRWIASVQFISASTEGSGGSSTTLEFAIDLICRGSTASSTSGGTPCTMFGDNNARRGLQQRQGILQKTKTRNYHPEDDIDVSYLLPIKGVTRDPRRILATEDIDGNIEDDDKERCFCPKNGKLDPPDRETFETLFASLLAGMLASNRLLECQSCAVDEDCDSEVCTNGSCNIDASTPCGPQPVCGDGVTDSVLEECDDGNTINEDGCDDTCVIEDLIAVDDDDPDEVDNLELDAYDDEVTIDVLNNDCCGKDMIITDVTNSDLGDVSISGDGKFILFHPDENFRPPYKYQAGITIITLEYTVVNEYGLESEATIVIEVTREPKCGDGLPEGNEYCDGLNCDRSCGFCLEGDVHHPDNRICTLTAPPTSTSTSSPTSSPTTSPTSSPTTSPTGSPTSSPTPSPTSSPTTSPTSSPTSSPNASPTEGPTSSPTSSPTSAPTSAPTSSPTSSPTESPTSSCAEVNYGSFTIQSRGQLTSIAGGASLPAGTYRTDYVSSCYSRYANRNWWIAYGVYLVSPSRPGTNVHQLPSRGDIYGSVASCQSAHNGRSNTFYWGGGRLSGVTRDTTLGDNRGSTRWSITKISCP